MKEGKGCCRHDAERGAERKGRRQRLVQFELLRRHADSAERRTQKPVMAQFRLQKVLNQVAFAQSVRGGERRTYQPRR